jgi:hypothetical protein
LVLSQGVTIAAETLVTILQSKILEPLVTALVTALLTSFSIAQLGLEHTRTVI